MNRLVNLKEASKWASNYLNRSVSVSNISYLVQYGKIKKHIDNEGTKVDLDDLKEYYEKHIKSKREKWVEKLGKDLNWNLSFDHLREVDTTKHVHRLHPYKGKFIPQLVEYFLDDHLNEFKKQIFFKKGDIILDPFMGSGTTLVQCLEMGLHSIGIDISKFNCMIAQVKVNEYDINQLDSILTDSLEKTTNFSQKNFSDAHDRELAQIISIFNKVHFPNPEYKYQVNEGKIDEEAYSKDKLDLFFKLNNRFLKQNGTKENSRLIKENLPSFSTIWFPRRIKQELTFYIKLINSLPVKNEKIKDVMKIILSRTARSCRATTHFDLATLKRPQLGPYYCHKHKKICMPVNSIIRHLKKNTLDTIRRLEEFSTLRKNVQAKVLYGDTRKLNIIQAIKEKDNDFAKLLEKNKITGIFTSPPYVGQIDYHDQHVYAYELFNIPRKDEEEIGPKSKGKTKKAQEEYIEGISQTLLNIGRFVKPSGHFFIVANDNLNIYPEIAKRSNLKIVNQFKRPVLNRTERDKQPYAETIFHMVKK